MDAVLTAAGWAGGTLCLVAYILLILEKLHATGTWFNVLNIISGMLLVGSAFAAGALPNMVFNLLWCSWGLYGLAARRPQVAVVPPAAAACPTCCRPAGRA